MALGNFSSPKFSRETVLNDLQEWLEHWQYFSQDIIEFVIDEILAFDGNLVWRDLAKKGEPASKELREKFGLSPKAKAGEYLTFLNDMAIKSDYSPPEILEAFVKYPIRQQTLRDQIARAEKTKIAMPYFLFIGGIHECKFCDKNFDKIWQIGKQKLPTIKQCPNIQCSCGVRQISKFEYERRK